MCDMQVRVQRHLPGAGRNGSIFVLVDRVSIVNLGELKRATYPDGLK